MKITTVGLDIAKSAFHLYAVNKMGRYMKKKQLKRKQVLPYLARLEPCVIAMEACGGQRAESSSNKEPRLVRGSLVIGLPQVRIPDSLSYCEFDKRSQVVTNLLSAPQKVQYRE
jgi:hypothetical protein